MKKRNKIFVGTLTLGVLMGGASLYKSSNTLNDVKATSSISNNELPSSTKQSSKVFTNSDSDKTQLLNMMINSTSYFNTAKGEFDYYSKNADTKMTIEFDVDILNHKSYEKNIYNNLKTKAIVSPEEESIFDGRNYTVVRNDDFVKAMMQTDKMAKTSDYTQFSTKKITIPSEFIKSSRSIETIDERYETIDGQNTYIRKTDTSLMGITRTTLLPEDFATGFMGMDLAKWEIHSNKTYLNRNCVEITTHLNEYYQEKHHGKSMDLLVDCDTGILMKATITDENGNVTFAIQMNKLTLNETIENEVFNKYESQIKG